MDNLKKVGLNLKKTTYVVFGSLAIWVLLLIIVTPDNVNGRALTVQEMFLGTSTTQISGTHIISEIQNQITRVDKISLVNVIKKSQ